MSSYLVYFEQSKNILPDDFRQFEEVNRFSLPDPFIGEPCRVNIGGQIKNGQLITYGGNAPPLFSFGKNQEGQNGQKLRDILVEFIGERLQFQCVQPMPAVVLVDDGFNHDFHPELPPQEISTADLSSRCVGEKLYNRLFLITE